MGKRPVELEDLLKFRIAGAAQISPEGLRAAFAAKRIDAKKNQYHSRLWLADAETGRVRPFTGDERSDGEPRWSPDGSRIAFLSDREKSKGQIYLIEADGGEAWPLTKLEEGSVQSISWSPDGSRIAFLHRSTPPQWTEKAKKEREEKGLSAPVRSHDRLSYRLDGFGYFDDSHWQIRIADAKTGETAALTDEPFPHGAPTWSPDGETIAFIANRRDDADLDGMRDDLWTVPASGGEIRRIEAPDGPKYGLAWSPDGRWLAYIGHDDARDAWGDRNESVWIVAADGSGEFRNLTGYSDKAVGYLTLSDLHETGDGPPLVWSPDGSALYCPVSERGDTRLYRVGLNGEMTPLTPIDREMGSFSVSRDGTRFGILLGSAVELSDAYLGELGKDGLTLRRLSETNRELLAEVELQMPDPVEAPRPGGGTVPGWILKPIPFEAGKKYPCIVYVHGGPSLQYGGRSAPFHELQWLAARGYVVLFPNPRGSKGYGEAHASAIRGEWGGPDWEDVQATADYGAALPFVDAERMAIMGGSYGGFMTAWAVGHTDRFRCAIADRLVGNHQSFSGTCDFPYQHEVYFKGNAWDDPTDLWRNSPIAYAGRINTPLLLIHSEGDLRCPIGQAEELFAALRQQRKTVEFVRYPAESGHGMSRNGPPDLRLDRLRRNLTWLDKHLK